MKKISLFLSLIFIGLILYAQKPILRFNQIGRNQGLSNNNVWAIEKDKNGFLWFGTEDGLNLYDGYSFKIFRSNPKDTNTISSNSIHVLCKEGNNTWIGTSEGLNLYNWTQSRFEHYKPSNHIWLKINNFNQKLKDIKVWRNSINFIVDLKNNKILVGTDLGILEFNTKTKKFNKINTKNKKFDLDTISVNSAQIDKNNIVWIGSKSIGLLKYDYKTGLFEQIPKLKDVISIQCDDNNKLWLGSYDCFTMYNTQTKEIKEYRNEKNNTNSIIANQVDAIHKSPDGLLWLGTTNGLSLFNPQKEEFYNYIPSTSDKKHPSNFSIKAFYRDKSGIVWVATRNGGVAVFDPKATKFEHFQNDISNPNSLTNNVVDRIVEDENKNIWIATDGGGVNKLDRSNNTFTSLQAKSNDKNSLNANKTLSLYANKKGGLWIGMWEGGMNYYDFKTQKFTSFKSDGPSGYYEGSENESRFIYNNRIFYLQGDTFGDLWIAHWGAGLSRYDIKNKIFHKYPKNNASNLSEMHSHVGVCLLFDEKQNLWYGTQQTGLYYWDRKSDQFTRYTHDDKNPNSVSNNTIFSLLEDSKKRIWIGTEGGGLNLFDPKTKKFKAFRMTDGLPSDAIMGILEDNQGRIWLSTGNGLSCAKFELKNGEEIGHFKNFTIEDGLQGAQFSRWASFKSSNGELYFGGLNGFNIVQPEKIKDNDFIPPIVFTDFQIRYKSVIPGTKNSALQKNILETKEIVLTYDQDILTFEFSSLNYTHSHKNQYSFFMKGFDRDWLNVGNQRKATYTNLSPGDYTFYVKGSNNDGIWNETPISIQLKILPPWWSTWWFRLIIFIIVISSVGTVILSRIRKIKRQNERLELLVKKRTQELEYKNNELKERHFEIVQQKEEIFQQMEELATQRDNLTDKNTQIGLAHQQISLAHDHIKSSIRYAKTIQQAILPDIKYLKSEIDCFILYQPKDVVSGDFYWYSNLNNPSNSIEKDYILATVDCTGHGVPGAFMSMIGSNILNKIINENKIYDPAEILTQLDLGVFEALKQETSDNTDGMDIVLCRIVYEKSEKIKICFSGARSQLYYYENKNKEVSIIKGSHKYIGGKFNQQKETAFYNNEIELVKGDLIYLATDGCVDQNNMERKRFGSQRLIELIKSIAHLSTEEQKMELNKTISNWQGDTVQRDDITVIGIRL